MTLNKRQPRKPNQKKAITNWRCVDCSTDTTPVKRGGPKGPATLCNACGLKLAKRRKTSNAARRRGKPLESDEQRERREQREAEEELVAEEMRRTSEARERENARKRNEAMRKRREEKAREKRAREQQQLQHNQVITQSCAMPIHQPIHRTHPSSHLASTFLTQIEQQKTSQHNHSSRSTPMEDVQSDWLNNIFGACDAALPSADEFAAEARAAAERSVEGVDDSLLPEVIQAAMGINMFSNPNQVIPYHSPTDVNLSSGLDQATPMVSIPNHNVATMCADVQGSVHPLDHMKVHDEFKDANVNVRSNTKMRAVEHDSAQCFSVPRQESGTADVGFSSQESMEYGSSRAMDTNGLALSGRNMEALASLQGSQSVGARWQAEMRSVVYGQMNNGVRNIQTGSVRSVPMQTGGQRVARQSKAEWTGGCNVNVSTGQVRMTVDELMRSDAETMAQYAPQMVDEIEERLMAQQEAIEQLGDISMMLEERSNMVADEMLRSKEAIAMLNQDAAWIRTLIRKSEMMQ